MGAPAVTSIQLCSVLFLSYLPHCLRYLDERNRLEMNVGRLWI